VMFHRVAFADNYATEFTFTDGQSGSATDWYYVRVFQTNGSMAWSSPIWVRGK
jgi:hypothetical protein